MTRKIQPTFTPDQKQEYAMLMVEKNYSTRPVVKLSGAGSTTLVLSKKQYLAELKRKL